MYQIFFSLNLLISLAIATVVGLGGTWLMLEADLAVEKVEIGPWTAHIPVGRGQANPYVRAAVARTGAIPLAATEALSFVATTDDKGNPFSSTCSYQIASSRIDSRWWTITLSQPDGKLIPAPMARHAFNSNNVLRKKDGTFAIQVSGQPQSGNWLPSGKAGSFFLTLRLYDTALYTNGGFADTALPSIEQGACS